MDRLAKLALGADGQVDQETATALLAGFTRAQLKEFLAALRREIRRRRISVEVAGEPGASVSAAMAERYPGRAVEVSRQESLGGGVRLRAGDDIVDASIQGYIKGIIEKLEGT
jgi:hypothetical protein